MRRVTAIAILIGLPLSATQADVYRSVDAQGHVQYSDTPSPGAELIQVSSSRPSSTPASNAPPGNSGFSPTKVNAQIHEQLTKEDLAREVHSDVAQTRAEQCQKAQDDYQKQVLARRIYTTGADGQRQYLSDAEADQQRLNTRQQMEDLCKPQ